MNDYNKYRRSQIAELAAWNEEFDMSDVSISTVDIDNGSPKAGDMIARNPVNHKDKWLVAAAYFAANFEPVGFEPAVKRGGYSKPAINHVVSEDVRKFRAHINRHPENSNAADWYQELAVRSAIYPGKGTPLGLMYCALGLGEAGEVQNKVKKAFRDDHLLTEFLDEEEASVFPGEVVRAAGVRKVYSYPSYELTNERRQQIIKELGGNLWYIAALCDEIGTTIGEVMASNLEELASRSERGTLSGDGDNR